MNLAHGKGEEDEGEEGSKETEMQMQEMMGFSRFGMQKDTGKLSNFILLREPLYYKNVTERYGPSSGGEE